MVFTLVLALLTLSLNPFPLLPAKERDLITHPCPSLGGDKLAVPSNACVFFKVMFRSLW
jgi:hypothetical protein